MNEKQKRILCLGDSNTYGYDPRGTLGGRYPREMRWTGQLGSAELTVFNRGMNGCTVPPAGQYSAFAELVSSLLPLDDVVILLGTNDVLQGRSAEETAERMALFLDSMIAHAGDAKMILLAPPPLTFGDWVQSTDVIAESEKLAPYYERLARERQILFADAGQWGIGLAFDGVHFTPEGHAAFFKGLSALSDCF